MCQIANRFRAVKSHDYYESGRRKNAVLPNRHKRMVKRFPPVRTENPDEAAGMSVKANVKYARRPIVDVLCAIENCRKLLTCSVSSPRTLEYANSSDGARAFSIAALLVLFLTFCTRFLQKTNFTFTYIQRFSEMFLEVVSDFIMRLTILFNSIVFFLSFIIHQLIFKKINNSIIYGFIKINQIFNY